MKYQSRQNYLGILNTVIYDETSQSNNSPFYTIHTVENYNTSDNEFYIFFYWYLHLCLVPPNWAVHGYKKTKTPIGKYHNPILIKRGLFLSHCTRFTPTTQHYRVIFNKFTTIKLRENYSFQLNTDMTVAGKHRMTINYYPGTKYGSCITYRENEVAIVKSGYKS